MVLGREAVDDGLRIKVDDPRSRGLSLDLLLLLFAAEEVGERGSQSTDVGLGEDDAGELEQEHEQGTKTGNGLLELAGSGLAPHVDEDDGEEGEEEKADDAVDDEVSRGAVGFDFPPFHGSVVVDDDVRTNSLVRRDCIESGVRHHDVARFEGDGWSHCSS